LIPEKTGKKSQPREEPDETEKTGNKSHLREEPDENRKEITTERGTGKNSKPRITKGS